MNKKDWTLLELLNWTTQYFEEEDIEDPRLNAELLLSDVADMERIMLYARFEETATPELKSKYRELVRQRGDHKPLQYLLGYTEFYGRRLKVTPEVLIPRQETELLVEKCLEKIPEADDDVFAIADIGTGSGAIAVTLACERENVMVHAVDNSSGALQIASHNAEEMGVSERVSVQEGDLYAGFGDEIDETDRFDLIVSNPPYIPTAQLDELQPEVKDWEPRQALDGGDDGLDVLKQIIGSAPDFLKESGWLVLEIGENQFEDVKRLVEEDCDGFFAEESIESVQDGTGCRRVFAVESH